MKKAILLAVSSLFASVSFAQNSKNIVCSDKDYSVELKIVGNELASYTVTSALEYTASEPYASDSQDGITQYSIRVDEGFDSHTWFEIYLKEGHIVKRELVISGNDSDNYQGSVVAEGDAAFTCNEQ